MYSRNDRKDSDRNQLLGRYEAVVQDGGNAYFEENDFQALLDHFEEEQELDKAMQVVDMALEQHRHAASLHYRKARLLAEQGDIQAAQASLHLAEVMGGEDLDVLLLKADILSATGRHGEALQVLDGLKGTKDAVELSDVYLAEAAVQEDKADYAAMFLALKKAIGADVDNRVAFERMWFCVEMGRKFEESAAFHKKLLKKHPFTFMAWYNLGQAKFELGHYAEALNAFEYAFLNNEEFSYAYYGCIDTCLVMEDYARALQYCQEAMDALGANADLYCRMGHCHENLKDFQAAKQCFLDAIREEPEQAEAHRSLGECYFALGEWLPALHSFEAAVQFDGQNETHLVALGETAYRLGKMDDAEAAFLKAVAKSPDAIECWMQLVAFYLAVGKPERAMEAVAEAKVSCPESTDLDYCEVAALFATGQRQEAKSRLVQALTGHPQGHELLFDLEPTLRNDPEVVYLVALGVGK
jgi:tetratricopeptide (TPR) repeat protein